MAESVEQILSEPGRRWSRQPGADACDVDRLVAASPCPLPGALLELLRFSNGGEGDLALSPRLFMLGTVDEILVGLRDPFLTENFVGFVFFGGNGGLERIALDCRQRVPPFPVVMIDPIAGAETAEQIAPDASSFVSAIGLTYHDGMDDA